MAILTFDCWLSMATLETGPLPPQRLVLSGQTHGERVWETAYTVWIQIMQHLPRAVDLLYGQISLCKVPRATKLVEQSRSGRSNV